MSHDDPQETEQLSNQGVYEMLEVQTVEKLPASLAYVFQDDMKSTYALLSERQKSWNANAVAAAWALASAALTAWFSISADGLPVDEAPVEILLIAGGATVGALVAFVAAWKWAKQEIEPQLLRRIQKAAGDE